MILRVLLPADSNYKVRLLFNNLHHRCFPSSFRYYSTLRRGMPDSIHEMSAVQRGQDVGGRDEEGADRVVSQAAAVAADILTAASGLRQATALQFAAARI